MSVTGERVRRMHGRASPGRALAREGWQLGRRPELDGLRGLAVLLVVVSHAGSYGLSLPVYTLGSAGVSVFFTLSGFLITSLLVEEHTARGSVDLRSFYLRRVRRLGPALLVMVGVVTGVTVASGRWDWLAVGSLTYSANWMEIAGYGHGSPLTHTWSLAIEEQFYVVWPLVFVAAARWRRGPLVVAAIAVIGSTVLRVVCAGDRAYYGSDTQAGAVLVGCALAILAHQGLREWRVPPWATAVAAFYLFGWALDVSRWGHDVLAPTVVPLITAALIWAGCSRPGGVLASAWLRYVGSRSYALYLWHLPLIWFLGRWFGRSGVEAGLAVALSFVVAECSWRYVERPFLVPRRQVELMDHAQQDVRPRRSRVLKAPGLAVPGFGRVRPRRSVLG